ASPHSTCRPSPGTAIVSACLLAVSGRSSSTATRPTTAGAARVISAGCRRRTLPGTASRTSSISPCPRSPGSSSNRRRRFDGRDRVGLSVGLVEPPHLAFVWQLHQAYYKNDL